MFNILIITYLIGSIIDYIKGSRNTTLNCGIWAFMGSSCKDFNVDKFTILGVANDSRGGDATGMVIDNQIYHHTKMEFSDMVKKFNIPMPKKYPIVLGHSRKATRGGDLIQFTQPFMLNEKNRIIGVGNHNGTLFNEEELIKMYNIPKDFHYKTKSSVDPINYEPNDTQILLYVLLKLKDYSILENYRGAAALIWHDRQLDKSFVFKGASKKYLYAKEDEEERSLYMYNSSKGIWFSSLEKPLWLIASGKEPSILPVENNNLLVIENGEITNIEIIQRKEPQHNQKGYNNNYTTYNAYDRYEDYNDGYAFQEFSRKAIDTTPNTNLVVIKNGENINSALYKFKNEEINSETNTIEFTRGRYYNGSNLANGVYLLDELGIITHKGYSQAKNYYFIDGIMIKSHTDYHDARRVYKKINKGNLIPWGLTERNTKSKKIACGLLPYSMHPITEIEDSLFPTYCTSELNSSNDWRFFNDAFTPLFSDVTYRFHFGDIVSIEKASQFNIADHTISKQEKFVENDEEWQETFVKTTITDKMNEVMKILDSIESDITDNSNLIVSRKTQVLIDTLKDTITASELNFY